MPKQKYKRRPASEIQKILSDFRASGQSQKKFCAENQIPTSSFYLWLIKSRKIQPPSLPAVIPVGTVPGNTSAIEIELPQGELIRLEQGINGPDLETVLMALKRC